MAIYFLAEDFDQFPDPEQADESGLLAVGGNLAPETLLKAYHAGIFPWYNEDEPICWFSPGERCVIFRDRVRISKSMRQLFNKGIFTITRNLAFEQVMAHCATVVRPDQEGTWIVEDMQKAYKKMHALGHASSIEVWQNEKLVGGLYGVEQGAVFCGESMFSLVPNASKAALIHLCTSYDYALIDCQVENPHLLSMGAELMPRHEFLELLQRLRR